MKLPLDDGRSPEERPPTGPRSGRRLVKINEVVDIELTAEDHGGFRAIVAVPERPRHDVLWLAEKIVGGWAETLRLSLLALVVVVTSVIVLTAVLPLFGISASVCATMVIVAMQSARRRAVMRHRAS